MFHTFFGGQMYKGPDFFITKGKPPYTAVKTFISHVHLYTVRSALNGGYIVEIKYTHIYSKYSLTTGVN